MSDLLKQAIADAKAVRATALQNAKMALEEAFAPQLQSMLATKLQQEVEDETSEELPEEPATPMDAPVDAPMDAPVDVAPVTDEVPVADVPPMDFDAADMAPPVEAPVAPEAGTEEELPMEEFDVTANPMHNNLSETEKASSDYKKTTTGHKTEDPGKKMVKKAVSLSTPSGLKSGPSTPKASSDYKKTTSGAKTEDPQGASNELSKGPSKTDTGTSALEEGMEIDESSLDEILRELEAEVSAPVPSASEPRVPEPSVDMDEEISLEGLFEDEDEVCNEEMNAGFQAYLDDKKVKESDMDEGDKNESKNENISLKKELQEYRSAVQYLRNQLNEVNLLNAKLLYTNKLFKQANLTNEQKLKVIEQFDLTKTVREAKLTYANMSESLNFGGKKAVVQQAPVARKVAAVKTITEGLASKSIGSTKSSKAEVLTEGAELANRFKKLAGIRSK